MGSHEVSSINSLYHEPYDFSLSFHDDMETFTNLKEFAAVHEIDGVKVPCVTTRMGLNDTNYDGALKRGFLLWIGDEFVSRVEPGMIVRVDGRQYVVSDARKLQGEMWRIELEVYDG